uniref:Uncharacterized protein n=1 Tax=Strongyloides papillosus TaxID=174720 RepID=A0A0N5B6Q2_STREA
MKLSINNFAIFALLLLINVNYTTSFYIDHIVPGLDLRDLIQGVYFYNFLKHFFRELFLFLNKENGNINEITDSKPITIFNETLKKEVCLKKVKEEKKREDNPINSTITSIYIDLQNMDKSSLEFTFKSNVSETDDRICAYFIGDIVKNTYNCTTTECLRGVDYSEDINWDDIDLEGINWSVNKF